MHTHTHTNAIIFFTICAQNGKWWRLYRLVKTKRNREKKAFLHKQIHK